MSSPTTQDATGPGQREFVLLISSVMMLVAFAIDSMLPALPAIAQSLNVADASDQPLVLTAVLIGFGISLLFVGTISDRFGRRWLLLASLVLYGLTSLAAATAQSFEMLLVARAAQGVAAAGGQVLVRALVRDLFEGREMARVMSLAAMIFMAGPIIAPSMGQAVLAVASWRWIFIVLAGLGFIIWSWSFFRLAETLPPERRVVISRATITANARTVLGDRMSCGYMLASAATSSALFGFLNSVQPIFEKSFHRPDFLPTAFAIMAGGMMAASFLNASIVRRFGMRRIGHAALMVFTALAGLHLLYSWSGQETMTSFIILQMLMMLAFPMIGGNFQAMAMERMGAVAGVASSIQGFVINITSALVGLTIGRAFDGTTVPLYVGYFLGGLVALIIVFVTEHGQFFVARHAPVRGE